MPMSRYEIRNEYSLADPELYRAADKEDPEALLEGVAMSGLVGVLRQLGDLAEFAAEIFHNLHEEVMATAARGHSLMTRVEQLETEVPSIARAFLSQTDHSSFFHHPGVDWHPNIRLDQNLVTQGDLPRFIMDSYEECRAPPRLFLLDKFDVAGAGACLKRYTDPSFFKVETSEMTGADAQREKKIRKAKKKGLRWRNGETPEVLPISHTKLHQLFLEERVENGVSNPSRRVKLKRRLNGFPFESKSGMSYMEKLLKSPSPDHEVLHKNHNSSQLMLVKNDNKDFGLEIFEVRSVSPDRESWGRKRSRPPSPEREEIMLIPSMYEPNEPHVDDEICEMPNSYPSIATDGISSNFDRATDEKVLAVDAESHREEVLTGYQSDDVVSEAENYVDAPAAIESETDGESELRLKSDITSSHMKNEPFILDADEEHTRSSSDSQSNGESISDGMNNSSTKEMSSFSSGSPSSAENPQSEDFSAPGVGCADIPVTEIVDASSYQKTTDEDSPADHSKPVVHDDTCRDSDVITNQRSDFEQLTPTSCSDGLIPTLTCSDSKEVMIKCMLTAPEPDAMFSTLDDENKTNLVIDPPYSPSVSGFKSHLEVDSPRSSAREHLLDEPNGESVPCISNVPDTTYISVKTSSDSLHEDGSEGEGQNLVDGIASKSNMFTALLENGNPETVSPEDLIPGKQEDEFEAPENSPNYPDIAHNGDNIELAASDGVNLISVLDNEEDSNVSTDSPDNFPCVMEASLGKELEETSLANAQTVNVEDNRSMDNQTSSENLKLPHLANSSDRLMEGHDETLEGDVISEEETTVNETLGLGTSDSYQVVGLQGTGITHQVSPSDLEALESSCSTPEDLNEAAGTSDTVELEGDSVCLSSSGQEITEISNSADPKSVNEVHELLDKSDSEADKSNITDMAAAVADNVSPDKLVEEHNHCLEDSENDKNCPSESHVESHLVEKMGPTKAFASDFEKDFCDTFNNDHPESEVPGILPSSYLDLEVDHGLEFVQPATIQSPVEQRGMDRKQELFNQKGLEDHVLDAPPLADYDTEESPVQEKTELPPSKFDQELQHPGEITLELSPLLSTNHPQMLDHNDRIGDNDSASAFSFVDCQIPASISELPRLSNHEINAPGNPKDRLGSIFPPNNAFAETSQINLADLPPLPPLPPVQWRMGKLQHASSSTEGEVMRHKELFPQLASPPTVPTEYVSSSPPTTSTDYADPSPATASTNNVNSSLQVMNLEHSPMEIASETASKEESVENSCSGLEANTLNETIASETASKEESVENRGSGFGADALNETTDPPTKIENKQQQFSLPIPDRALASPAEEEGVENGSRTVKLPRPRNPLIDDVAVLDKSKLRKVTERIRPEIQKVDERDSLLEQIRTKSFNLKPAMASRPSIRGPNTNLKVAAILEKANAIRQAFAGSDEDDDDSWSDS